MSASNPVDAQHYHPHGDQDTGSLDGPLLAIDGRRLRVLFDAALAWLGEHHEIVNALNVFPVPDGDTGTNMLLTMKSAVREIGPEQEESVGETAKAAAHGALMGARGNSGVILSQILRGMARSIDGKTTLTAPHLAAALAEGSRVAYKGVNRPVEGTILTVARKAGEAAEETASRSVDVREVLRAAVEAADQAVEETPKLLPVLAQAGKVDSGGKGFYYILQGMYRELTGLAGPAGVALSVEPAAARPAKGKRELPPLVYGFDVQFLVEGANLDVQAIRDAIAAIGDCPLVEGDETLVKVHVHVPNPGVALTYAVGLGFVTDVVVENMDDMQIPEMPPGFDPLPPRFGSPSAEAAVPEEATVTLGPIEGPAVIAVAPGEGLAEVFRSLGAHRVVSGGQTMNPSTQDLLKAIEALPADEIIILPNNSNIIMTAQQAQALTSQAGEGAPAKQVMVVASKTIPQGISALLALNPHADLSRNVDAMAMAARTVQTGEVTLAVQDASFDGVHVRAGDVIGLLNDTLTASGDSPTTVVRTLLEQMAASELEVITLYFGEPVTSEDAMALRDLLRVDFPDQEIEIVFGGQPFYHYIISAE